MTICLLWQKKLHPLCQNLGGNMFTVLHAGYRYGCHLAVCVANYNTTTVVPPRDLIRWVLLYQWFVTYSDLVICIWPTTVSTGKLLRFSLSWSSPGWITSRAITVTTPTQPGLMPWDGWCQWPRWPLFQLLWCTPSAQATWKERYGR